MNAKESDIRKIKRHIILKAIFHSIVFAVITIIVAFMGYKKWMPQQLHILIGTVSLTIIFMDLYKIMRTIIAEPYRTEEATVVSALGHGSCNAHIELQNGKSTIGCCDKGTYKDLQHDDKVLAFQLKANIFTK